MSFNIFDENFYLNNNPDVKAAVQSGAIKSGLEHFQKYGLAEGRGGVSPFFDEKLYLQKNQDVAAAVANGSLKSGLQHYIQYGEAEGRSPGAFDEQAYLKLYPDVAAAVKGGFLSSGLEHYIKYGQFESNRVGVLSGTSGNDTLTGLSSAGKIDYINGVDVGEYTSRTNGDLNFSSKNFGSGEVDTLIGGPGNDVFVLGASSQQFGFNIPQGFYVGGGDNDYAVIKNFEPGKDAIQLAGYSPITYSFVPDNGNLKISTITGDLIATVEGVSSLSQISSNNSSGTILFG